MKTLSLLAVLTICVGCQTFEYETTDKDGKATKIKRQSKFTKTQVQLLEVETDQNGIRKASLKGYSSDTQAAADALNGATKVLEKAIDKLPSTPK